MNSSELTIGKQGRLVIPANIRHELAIVPGSKLLARVENGRLVMESKTQLWQAVHQACANVPQQSDLAQELIDERRAAAKRENI